jgi:hypothetical protein
MTIRLSEDHPDIGAHLMGIVSFALKYRHTFYVMALAMFVLGMAAILSQKTSSRGLTSP